MPGDDGRWRAGSGFRLPHYVGDDAEGRSRRGVYLSIECWEWLAATATRDGTSRSDLLEGLVLLAMDADLARTGVCPRQYIGKPPHCGDVTCRLRHPERDEPPPAEIYSDPEMMSPHHLA